MFCSEVCIDNHMKVTYSVELDEFKEMDEFWETHDATDYDDRTHEVTMEFDLGTHHHYIAVDPELLARLRRLAQARGISLESLANLWLQGRISAAEN
jgi:hypothetical protein